MSSKRHSSKKNRSHVKRGGFEYAKMLRNPLSPCYTPPGKPEVFKAGWHAGGSAKPCDYEPPVGELVNIASTDCVNPSQKAWFNRYSCPKNTQAGGKKSKSKSKTKKTVKKSKSKTKKTVKKSKSKKSVKKSKKTVKKSKSKTKKTVRKSKSKKN